MIPGDSTVAASTPLFNRRAVLTSAVATDSVELLTWRAATAAQAITEKRFQAAKAAWHASHPEASLDDRVPNLARSMDPSVKAAFEANCVTEEAANDATEVILARPVRTAGDVAELMEVARYGCRRFLAQFYSSELETLWAAIATLAEAETAGGATHG